jgi:Cytochrome b(C-terminal)/b6/petD
MPERERHERRLGAGAPAAHPGATAHPAARIAHGREPADATEPRHGDVVTAWPHLFFREVLAGLLFLVVLGVLAILVDAPLEEAANPLRTPSPAKAPWYFVGLQELLTYFDPWVAGVMIPLAIVIGLCAIPYIDPTRSGQGVYTVRERPFASAIFIVGLAGWLLLIVVGAWFRGPGWVWMWPWAAGAVPHAAAPQRALPNLIGVPLVLAWFAGGAIWIVRRTAHLRGFTAGRRWWFALLLLAMAGTLVKIVARLAFGIQYFVRFPGSGLQL